MTNQTNVLTLLENEGMMAEQAKTNAIHYFKFRRDPAHRSESKGFARMYKALKQYENVSIVNQELTIEYVGENIVEDNVELANRIIDTHSDSEYHGLSTYSVAHERAFVSHTYKVTFSKVPDYLRFIQALIQTVKYNGCKKTPLVTFEEFADRKMANGQKIGRYLARCGVDNNFIGNLDHLLSCDDSVKYFTISGATQDIIGMSYFLNGASSCQDWSEGSGVGYALHSLAGSQTREQYVSYLHNSLGDLDHGFHSEHMQSRTTVLRAVESGVPVFYHGKIYGQDRKLHRQVLKVLDGHFNSYYERDDDGHGFEYYLSGGNHIEVSNKDVEEMTIGNEQGTSFMVCCPMCNGDGYIRNDVRIHGDYAGRVSHECPLCLGSGEYELELDEDFDGEYAVNVVGESELDDLLESESVFKFYDSHAFEGFVDNGATVKVFAQKSEVHGYVRKVRQEEGKGVFLEFERIKLLNGLIAHKELAGIESLAQVEAMGEMEMLEKFVLIYGLAELFKNRDLYDFYTANK